MNKLSVGFLTFLIVALTALGIAGLGFAFDAGIASVIIFGLFNSLSWVGVGTALTFYSSIAWGIVVMSAARALSFVRWAVK